MYSICIPPKLTGNPKGWLLVFCGVYISAVEGGDDRNPSAIFIQLTENVSKFLEAFFWLNNT